MSVQIVVAFIANNLLKIVPGKLMEGVMREMASIYLALTLIATAGCTSVNYAPLKAPYVTEQVICVDLIDDGRLFVAPPTTIQGDSLRLDVIGAPPMGLETAQRILQHGREDTVVEVGHQILVDTGDIDSVMECEVGPNWTGTLLLTATLVIPAALIVADAVIGDELDWWSR